MEDRKYMMVSRLPIRYCRSSILDLPLSTFLFHSLASIFDPRSSDSADLPESSGRVAEQNPTTADIAVGHRGLRVACGLPQGQ